jgi:hypothetical protein
METVAEQLKAILVADFNNKLTEISTEKGDSVELPSVDDEAYAFQTMDNKVINYDPFICYGVEDVENISNQQSSAEDVTYSAVIVLGDNGRQDINRIMLRYSRALKEVFEANWQNYNTGTNIEVSRSTVIPLEALDSSATYKAVGVQLKVVLS